MRKSDIRAWLKRQLAEPKNRSEAKLRTLDRALVLSFTTMMTWITFATGNGPAMALIIASLSVVAICVYEFVAKGR